MDTTIYGRPYVTSEVSNQRSCPSSSPVSSGVGNHLHAGKLAEYNRLLGSTQHCNLFMYGSEQLPMTTVSVIRKQMAILHYSRPFDQYC